MVEALIIGTILASIGAAAGIYTNQQNIKNNNARWNASVDLADTAHQREVADLRAAGLNPILSAGGSGSAVPSMTTATAENPGQGFSDIASTVANASLTAKMHEGDIAEQMYKKKLFEDPKVLEAMRDKTILQGSPTNPYQAAYLGLNKGADVGKSWWQRLTSVLDTTPQSQGSKPDYTEDFKALDKAIDEGTRDDGSVEKTNKWLEEHDKRIQKEGVWEMDENGKFHLVPNGSGRYNKNNKKLRRYHA